MATCSHLFVNHADCEQPCVSSQRRHSGHLGNPAICCSQTGSFASPACAGYALFEMEYNTRCANGHAVVVHRQAQKCRARKCDPVPANLECESDAGAICKCRFGARKSGVM